MTYESEQVGLDWLHSYEKRAFEAELMQGLRPTIIRALAHTVSMSYNCFGYDIFEQERFGHGCELRSVPKLQTQSGKDVPYGIEDNEYAHPILKIIRDMSFDEFPQLLRVSTNPDKPSDTALFGFRPQHPQKIENRYAMAAQYGYTAIVDNWAEAFKEVPTAVYDITSLLDSLYKPHSLEYELTSMKWQIYYRENASRKLDETIFYATLIGGVLRAKGFGLIQLKDPQEVFGGDVPAELQYLLARMAQLACVKESQHS